jgi:hypothetical protein
MLIRGESVSPESTKAKKENNEVKGACIGDKVDVRICARSPNGKVIDLINF